METTRRLSAILMADVFGYSRLMGQDEPETARHLSEYRQLFADHIARAHGRILNAPGDSILAEFSSVVDAVGCAVEIQRELTEKNAELPDDHRMRFRIGLNLGDVIVQEAPAFQRTTVTVQGGAEIPRAYWSTVRSYFRRLNEQRAESF